MRHFWLSAIILAGAIGTLFAGTDSQQLVTLTPPSARKPPTPVQPPETIQTLVVTPQKAPLKAKPAHAPAAKDLANTLAELRKPKPVVRPQVAQTVPAAARPAQPPSPAPPGAPIMLLPPPQAAPPPNMVSRDVWLQRRAILLDLTTARQFLVNGQTPDARHILDNAESHIRLFSSDRTSQQIAVAIRALDAGDMRMALEMLDRVLSVGAS